MKDGNGLSRRVEDLRRAFDSRFAAPHGSTRPATETFLAIAVGSHRLLVRLEELRGFDLLGVVEPLPAARGGLLGLVGIRGRLVPVFRLAALLGGGGAPEVDRWLAICGDGEAIGLSFPVFEGYVEVPRSRIHPASSAARTGGMGRHICEVAEEAGVARGVLRVDALLASLEKKEL